MDHQQPGSASSPAVLKPSVQHASFAVNPNAARQLQIEARLEQCRRQSPTPKNFLARLTTPSKKLVRSTQFPKPNQIADPVQSASEQLKVSTTLSSASSLLRQSSQSGITLATEVKTPSTSLNRSLPPLSASRPSVVSLESVILQRQRDREEKMATSKVPAIAVQRSVSEKSFFSLNTPTQVDLTTNSFTRSKSAIGRLANNSVLLSSGHGNSSPNGSDSHPQLVTLRSPAPAPTQLTSDVHPSPPPSHTASITELHYSTPTQPSLILDLQSESKFVPTTFITSPAVSSSISQPILPTERATASRVVQACRIRPATDANDSLRTLMALINPEPSPATAPDSLLADLSSSKISDPLIEANDKFLPSIAQSGSPRKEPSPDVKEIDPNLARDSPQLFGKVANGSSPGSHPNQAPTVQVSRSCCPNRGAAPNISPEEPAPLDNIEICKANSSFPAGLQLSLKVDDVQCDNAPEENGYSTPDEIDLDHLAHQDVSKSSQFISNEMLVSSQISKDVMERAADEGCAPNPSPAVASCMKQLEASPCKSLQGDLVSRRIITPKRSISLRKSSPIKLHSIEQTSATAEDTSHKEQCTPADRIPAGLSLPGKSPNDSVFSLDGSSSIKSFSGFVKGNEHDGAKESICVNNWFIEWQGNEPFLFGINSKTKRKVGGRIIRRKDLSVILIAGDKKLLLGVMDKKIMQRTFTDELVTAFTNGFPKNWLDVLQAEKPNPNGSTLSTPSITPSRKSNQRITRSQDKIPAPSPEIMTVRNSQRSPNFKRRTPRKKQKTQGTNGRTPSKRDSEALRVMPAEIASSPINKTPAASSLSSLSIKSDQSVAANSGNQYAELDTPVSRKRPRNSQPNTVPKVRKLSLSHKDSNMILELPLDAIEGVTFSHSGRRRVQPLKFWLTERIIAESGTICTMAATESPKAKRSKNKTTAAKTKSTSLTKVRKFSSRRKSR